MSRSYRKFVSYSQEDEFYPPYWPGIRMEERKCIHNELQSVEYGDVIFPKYYGSDEGSWYSSKRYYYPKWAIREHYFNEINYILRNFQKWFNVGDRQRNRNRPWIDYHKLFMDKYVNTNNRCIPHTRQCSDLEWMHSPNIKAVIKAWKGEPLDILYYLAHSGLIEKTVQFKYRKVARK